MEAKTIFVYSDTRGTAKCRGCGASITWAQVVKSGKRMCFDGDPVALRTRHDDSRRLIEELDLDTNHWATCPDAKTFKRAR
jgi:hypothetical protein